MSKNSKAYKEAAEKVDKTRLYSPLEAAAERTLRLPLHYAGLTAGDEVEVRVHDGAPFRARVDAREELTVRVVVPPRSATWIVVRSAR